jgi:hypothetical protein
MFRYSGLKGFRSGILEQPSVRRRSPDTVLKSATSYTSDRSSASGFSCTDSFTARGREPMLDVAALLEAGW